MWWYWLGRLRYRTPFITWCKWGRDWTRPIQKTVGVACLQCNKWRQIKTVTFSTYHGDKLPLLDLLLGRRRSCMSSVYDQAGSHLQANVKVTRYTRGGRRTAGGREDMRCFRSTQLIPSFCKEFGLFWRLLLGSWITLSNSHKSWEYSLNTGHSVPWRPLALQEHRGAIIFPFPSSSPLPLSLIVAFMCKRFDKWA